MTLLKTFATMALISGALLMLLPEGTLRKTAALVMGLMLTLCWVEGLLTLFRLPVGGDYPDTVLSATDTSIEALVEELAPEVTSSP